MAIIQGTSTQIGTGSDTMVLKISQDAYQGDSQYTVTVDGKLLGTQFTAKALHNSGQFDTLEIKGDWGVGNHTVAVRLTNDLYGGSPSTDRNIYVESAIYNGAGVSGSNLYLDTGVEETFSFSDTTPTPAPIPSTNGEAKLTFVDEFNSFKQWDGTSGWQTGWWYSGPEGSPGSAANGEEHFYIKDGYAPTDDINPWTVKDGILSLTATPTPANLESAVGGADYLSGMINSHADHSQLYGYFEIKAKLPSGQGMWPAFWLLPTDGASAVELDVMETVGHLPTTTFGIVHTSESGTKVYNSGRTEGNLTEAFHAYGMDWQSDFITFYLDGKEFHKIATPSDLKEKPMYMIANLAVGGHWPGSPDASTQFPSSLDIDYIKVWDKNPQMTYSDSYVI